ncbi:MAG: polysaccharide deacetylase family protein [Actinomycetota bacterium]|nr:polysaccharide deacetylase family protein [Actinomycetota bacterium]
MQRRQHSPRGRLRWLWTSLSLVLSAGVGLAGLWAFTSDGSTAPLVSGLRPDSGNPQAHQPAAGNTGSGNPSLNAPAAIADRPRSFGALSLIPRGPETAQGPAVVPDFALPPVTGGLVPVLTRIPTQQRVVFLTIDDGANKTAQEVELLRTNGIKATLFLAQAFIGGNPDFFKGFTADGSLVEDHSIGHLLNLAQLPYAQQKAEICGMADYEQQHYGRRPILFRPPGGPYTTVMRKAAADCGIKAIIDWEAKANAGHMDYQYGTVLRPGEIVLMHFRPEFAADFNAFLAAQKAAGLQVVLLEDYLKTG